MTAWWPCWIDGRFVACPVPRPDLSHYPPVAPAVAPAAAPPPSLEQQLLTAAAGALPAASGAHPHRSVPLKNVVDAMRTRHRELVGVKARDDDTQYMALLAEGNGLCVFNYSDATDATAADPALAALALGGTGNRVASAPSVSLAVADDAATLGVTLCRAGAALLTVVAAQRAALHEAAHDAGVPAAAAAAGSLSFARIFADTLAACSELKAALVAAGVTELRFVTAFGQFETFTAKIAQRAERAIVGAHPAAAPYFLPPGRGDRDGPELFVTFYPWEEHRLARGVAAAIAADVALAPVYAAAEQKVVVLKAAPRAPNLKARQARWNQLLLLPLLSHKHILGISKKAAK
jgi:hypothetical protein